MNIRTRLFHLSIHRDGWVFVGLLPNYAAVGFDSRNCPPCKWAMERVGPGDWWTYREVGQ